MRATSWRVARVTPLGELAQPSRITAAVVRLATQVFLVVCLWRALYEGVAVSGGLREEQAITYAVLAVLATQVRGLDHSAARDGMVQRVQDGSILFWYLRPLSPRRFYMLRAVGEQAYGYLWVLAGYLVCAWAGVVNPPASTGAAAAFAISVVLAQVLMYQLILAVDLLSFWTFQNEAALMLVRFMQSLLSGAIAPLWFFPEWFLAASWFLPFRYTLDIPLSLYVGRLPTAHTAWVLAGQVLWCVLTAAGNRMLWHRAAGRIAVQGG